MPSRIVSLIILIYWSIAAFCLLTWDVLPEMTSGYPPDLRAITQAVDSAKPITWSIQVIDDPRFPDVRRIVGEAVTGCVARPDGWSELTSRVKLDAGGLLKGTAFFTRSSIRLDIESRYLVDRSGNLHSFILEVKSARVARHPGRGEGRDQGKDDGDCLPRAGGHSQQEIVIGYEPKSVIQDVLGPLDRLPGLHVGQRWESQMINPFTGQVSPVKVEVKRRGLIHWNGNPVTTFEVVQHITPAVDANVGAYRTGSFSDRKCRCHTCGWCWSAGPRPDDVPSLPKTRVPGS